MKYSEILYSIQGEDQDISVEDAVAAILAYNYKQVVITRGEPFMQPQTLISLCQQLQQSGLYITIETNSTLFESVEANLLSISPKLANSNPDANNHRFQQHRRLRINQPVRRQFLNYYTYQLKFVVETESD